MACAVHRKGSSRPDDVRPNPPFAMPIGFLFAGRAEFANDLVK